jgi:xylulokinase
MSVVKLLNRVGHFSSRSLFLDKEAKVIVTGGASKNVEIVQVLADVFNARAYGVKDMASGNSACLGSAFRACYAVKCLSGEGKPDEDDHAANDYFSFVGDRAPELELLAEPSPDAARIYDKLVRRYEALEARVVDDSKI